MSTTRLSLQDVAVIELIIRQGWLDGNNPEEARFETWLGVDQDQALALLRLIPGRAAVYPKILPAFVESWPAINRERSVLIDKSISGSLTAEEEKRLDALQAYTDYHIEQVAPRSLPDCAQTGRLDGTR